MIILNDNTNGSDTKDKRWNTNNQNRNNNDPSAHDLEMMELESA